MQCLEHVPIRLLGPETTTEFEIGTNLEFFNGRIALDATYYNRETVDQNIPVDVSPASGFTSQFANAGTMRNSGIELSLNAAAVQAGDFGWAVNVNFATFNNEVVDIIEGVESISAGSTWAADLRIREGYPYMGVWGGDFIRQNYQLDEGTGMVLQNEGPVVVDSDGQPIGITPRMFLGSSIPDFTGGIRNVFTYKGLNLGVLVDFQKGGAIHSTSLQWAAYSGMLEETVFQNGVNIRENGLVLDAVDESGNPNTQAIDAQTYYTSYWNVAAPNFYDASYINLREVNLSYTLPMNFVQKIGFQRASVGVFGRNLALLHSNVPHIDPQVITGSGNVQGLENAQVPPTRSIGFNLGFSF